MRPPDGATALAYLERMLDTQVWDRLAACAAQDQRTRYPCPFLQLGEDPGFLLAHERFDVAPRRAQRRGNAQAVGVHHDAERAPAPAREAVFDRAPAKLDQQSAFCCSSIHASASRLMVAGSRPAGSIAGPMRTVTVPARLRNA